MVAGETGNRGGSTNVLGRMAEAARAAGDRDTTEGILDIALAVSDETVQPWWDSALYRIRAELSFAAAQDATPGDLSDPDHPWCRAERAWLRSLELAERMGFPVHGSRAAAGYAGLLQRVGRVDEGSALLASWYARCPERLGTPVLTAIRSQLEALDGIPI